MEPLDFINWDEKELSRKILAGMKGRAYSGALHVRTRIIVEHVFDKWPFPPNFRPHLPAYKKILLSWAERHVNRQLANEKHLSKVLEEGADLQAYFQRINSQVGAFPMHLQTEEIDELLKRHGVNRKKHFEDLLKKTVGIARRAPVGPEDLYQRFRKQQRRQKKR